MATTTTITCDRCKKSPKIIEQNIDLYWRHRTGIIVDLCQDCCKELDGVLRGFFSTPNFKEYKQNERR